jgi:predicted ATPase
LITEIAVKNFKTLRDVKIPLAPGITVMVGANNSGKSNALAVLKLLAQTEKPSGLFRTDRRFAESIEALGGVRSIYSRDGFGPLRVSLTATFKGRTSKYTYGTNSEPGEETPERRGDAGLKDWTEEDTRRGEWNLALMQFLGATAVHDFSVSALRAPAIIQRGAQLGPDGRDVAAVLDALAGEAPSLRDGIDETVRGAAHEVKRVVTRPGPEPGTKVLGIEELSGDVFGAEDMSDGLLLFIGLAVAAQLKLDIPCILAIEEPERGVHPRRIRDLVDHLLRLTKSGVQVVLTTHSPTLLDEFRDTPESVLIFDRDEEGTHITRLSDRPDWADQLKGMPLGDLWYSGVLGGVPGR